MPLEHDGGSRPVVLVAGASGSIGHAVAVALAMDGFDVALQHRGESSEITSVRDDVMRLAKAFVVPCTFEDEEAVDSLVEAVRECFGRLDALVVPDLASAFGYAANLGAGGSAEIRLNVIEPFAALCRRAAIYMKDRVASIVAVTGTHATRVTGHDTYFGTANLLLETLIPQLAGELRPNVAVTAVRTRSVVTESTRSWAEESYPGGFDRLRTDAVQRNSRIRLVFPEQLGEIVAFLCSPSGRLLGGRVLLTENEFTVVPGCGQLGLPGRLGSVRMTSDPSGLIRADPGDGMGIPSPEHA